MKRYVSSAAIICLLSLIGFSANADGNGNAIRSIGSMHLLRRLHELHPFRYLLSQRWNFRSKLG
ncbi:hypothetical protein SAMN02745132_00876 [Enterovibrio nigricans DSM 22720]|uniref:Uncharacterized protein n=1 Tax=Enterovibrio nigricans DSM 22720 TaxID=1121868 RepID=A0A1T4U6S0_9GAMM|nr:hypothetical protein SAMN02745132_00876 [Enterovibrio nigricans DSM 22720]